jgi:hypothetical protein
MKEAIEYALNAVRTWDWLALVEAGAAVWVAWVATLALRTWKHESKARKQDDLLDELIEAVHGFLGHMSRPIELLKFSKIGIQSHEPTHLGGDQRIKGAIAYIETRGAEDAKRVFEALDACRPSLTRIRSLVAKGQVFQYKDYHLCQNSAKMLTWQFDRIGAFAALIAMPSLNWENLEVIQSLEGVLTIEADDVQKHLEEHNVAILRFADSAYKQIYG